MRERWNSREDRRFYYPPNANAHEVKGNIQYHGRIDSGLQPRLDPCPVATGWLHSWRYIVVIVAGRHNLCTPVKDLEPIRDPPGMPPMFGSPTES